MQSGSLVTRARRFPGRAFLLALVMMLTQAFAAPFPVSPAGSEMVLTASVAAQNPHQSCGDIASHCRHATGSHPAVCAGAADCAVMHGWFGISAHAVPVPASRPARYIATVALPYTDVAAVPLTPPPRSEV